MNAPDKASGVSVITGMTSGLGRALFFELAHEGGPVIAVSRAGERSRRVVEEALARTDNSDLHLVEADLALLADVRRAADEIDQLCAERGVGRLVLNAATLTATSERTPEGFEKMFAVNHLSSAALALALEVPLKRASSPAAQVCVVSSDAHRWVAEVPLELFSKGDAGTKLTPLKLYSATKLAGLVFFAELARRWPEIRMTAHHPGFVSTGLGLRGPWWLRFWWRLSRWRMRRPMEAARELLAIAKNAQAVAEAEDGQLIYWEKAERYPLPAACEDAETLARVWQQTLAAIEMAAAAAD